MRGNIGAMKLGEALKLRSDNQRKIEELRGRAAASAQTQEGTKPPDDANALIADMERLFNETTVLIQRINRTNVATRLPEGPLLADALAQRDAYIALRTALQGCESSLGVPATLHEVGDKGHTNGRCIGHTQARR
jgi:hypothetical protein